MKNESGIYPKGNRVLVYVDQIEDGLKDSLIELPKEVVDKYQNSNASGLLIAVGPDAFSHVTETVYRVIDGGMKPVEVHKRGYSEPFAVPGQRISFAKYTGQNYRGKDNKPYMVINDEDITCQIDTEVELTDLSAREGVGL